MNNGLYTAASSLLLNQKRMDVISNNLANVNTTGFKKDVVLSESFPEVLLSKLNDGVDLDNHPPFNGVEVEVDGDAYNLKINSGYFKVKTPAGNGFSREIQFTIDDQGYLKTFYKDKNDNLKTDGENYILGKNGLIMVPNRNIEIDNRGNVISNGQVIDNLITFPHPSVIGTASGGVRLDKIATNFNQGSLTETGNNLDLAIKGDGFFTIYTDAGQAYTRDGSFTLNDNGELVTAEGHYVMGEYGSIMLDSSDFSINENGEIIVDGEAVDRLLLVDIANTEDLRKEGNNLYRPVEGVQAEEQQFNGKLLQGYLESSNIDTIKEMVNMITLLRSYEASQKIIQYQDELLGKAATEIGRV